MEQIEVELCVGQTIQIGSQFITVVDVDGPEVCVRVDHNDPTEFWGRSLPQGTEALAHRK